MITKLKKNEVFVFGSNLNGNHAGGAAAQALKWGAEMGVGEGHTGKCYAFPTLDKKMKKVSQTALKKSVKRFFTYAKEHPELTFLLTPVGTGIAGFTNEEIAPLFSDAPQNVVLPEEWRPKVLYKFLRTGMKSQHGNATWKVGEWKKEENINICNRGFHASNTPLEAFGYVNGEVLAKVEVRGASVIEADKSCWEEMRVIKAYHWTKQDSIEFAIYAAELVIDIYEKKYPNDKRPREAIEAAKKYVEALKSGDTDAADAAYAAADAAAYAADAAADAADAAADAADAAARAAYAADAAAYAAYAARAARAADAALREKLNIWFMNRIESLEEIH